MSKEMAEREERKRVSTWVCTKQMLRKLSSTREGDRPPATNDGEMQQVEGGGGADLYTPRAHGIYCPSEAERWVLSRYLSFTATFCVSLPARKNTLQKTVGAGDAALFYGRGRREG